jgi:hypothetical protein
MWSQPELGMGHVIKGSASQSTFDKGLFKQTFLIHGELVLNTLGL